MVDKSYEIDPDGDVILTLRNCSLPFAIWNEPPHPPEAPEPSVSSPADDVALPDKLRRSTGQNDLTVPEEKVQGDSSPHPVDESEPEIRMRVSSRHLTLASPYFKRALKGDWKESRALVSDGSASIQVEECDPEAVLILMNAIHGKARQVPRQVSLEMLAKIAVLVDYYDCKEAIEVYVEIWISKLQETIPDNYSRDLVLWICISWVFNQPGIFQQTTMTALRQSEAPIRTLGLPISDAVVDMLDQKRQEFVSSIINMLHELLLDLLVDEKGCSFECRSILLGSLIKDMDTMGIYIKRPDNPFIGFSFDATIKMAREIRAPRWCDHPSRDRHYNSYCNGPHSCTLDKFINPTIKKLEDEVKDLELIPIYLSSEN